jgi:two-component system, chemotaxis family, protein-glutamate methylesterase/glutaminase
MIRVLLTDDSPLIREILKDIFNTTDDIAVVGEAVNGRDAVAKTLRLKPDLLIMDLMMPVMDGLAAIEEIMAEAPMPILVLSASLEEREVNQAFSAIRKGALDVMEKPAGGTDEDLAGFSAMIIDKVRLLAKIPVIHHPRRFLRPEKPSLAAHCGVERSIIAIGASTGGPKGVMQIVKSFPADFRGTVFIVQHIARGFVNGFVNWLNSESRIGVRLAVDGDEWKEGEILVAPDDCHMILQKGRVRLVNSAPVNCCRPSIDLFFNSLAEEEGARVMSILLSGMGKDGAQGLRLIRDRGGLTIVQNEQSCAVFGMPKAAIELDAADEILPLSDIPAAIAKLFGR